MHHKYQFEYDEIDSNILKSLKADTKLNAPFVQGQLKVGGAYEKNYINYEVSGKLAKHEISTTFVAKLNEQSEGNYDIKCTAVINKHNAKLELSRLIQNGKSQIKNLFTASSGTRVEVNGNFLNSPTDQNADLHFTGLFLLASKEVPYG